MRIYVDSTYSLIYVDSTYSLIYADSTYSVIYVHSSYSLQFVKINENGGVVYSRAHNQFSSGLSDT